MNRRLSYKSKERLYFAFILTLVLLTIVWVWNELNQKEKVRANYHFSTGQLISYRSIGAIGNNHVTYSFQVDEIIYDAKAAAPRNIFEGCEYDFSVCSDKKFWVAYQKDDPSNSMINLHIQIQDLENPMPPKTLDGFW